MEHYNYSTRLKAIWDEAVAQYQSGNRSPDTFFDAATLAELTSIGLNPMDVFDPVEDFLDGAEIDFTTFLLVSDARRDYFLISKKASYPIKRWIAMPCPPKTAKSVASPGCHASCRRHSQNYAANCHQRQCMAAAAIEVSSSQTTSIPQNSYEQSGPTKTNPRSSSTGSKHAVQQ